MSSILFVCLGNICRSPTGEAIFRKKAEGRGHHIDSAGTGGWHAGDLPDPRSREAGEQRGYSFAGQNARQVTVTDFIDFDVILAMDAQNLKDLRRICPPEHQGKLHLYLEILGEGPQDVPDPYYGGAGGFDHVLDLVERAADLWLEKLAAA